MNKKKAGQSIDNLGQALARLREALDEPPSNSLLIDGTIQRFEFVIELFWKTFKRVLELSGNFHTNAARELETGLQGRYKNIQRYFPEMERAYEFLARKYATFCREDDDIYR